MQRNSPWWVRRGSKTAGLGYGRALRKESIEVLVRLPVEKVEGHRGEERRSAEVVVGQPGQDSESMTALRPALTHPAAVAEAAVQELEGLDVVGGRRHVG